jgi:type I restriction enzyme S subunit
MPASQERYLMASDGIRLVVNKVKFSVRFTHYLINHSTFRRNAIEVSTGTTRRRIGLSELKNLPVIYPSLLEQTKIANFLTAVDEKITLLTQKADLLSQYKKGVMQQIFSQELRFKDDDGQEFPEWEEKTLGDVADITTGNSNRIDSTIGDGAYTFFDRSQDIRTSDIYLFDCEAVIVAGEGQEFIPKHFIGKFDLHQRTYAIIKFKSASGKYLFYYIHNFRYYFLSQAVGSTVKSLRLPMFQQMPIQLPSLPEQTKIANFLTAIDEKITNNQNQLNAVKQYKQGLLQQMFV